MINNRDAGMQTALLNILHTVTEHVESVRAGFVQFWLGLNGAVSMCLEKDRCQELQ